MHYKKKVVFRSKKTKEIIEQEVLWYEKKIKEIYTKNNPLLIVSFKDIVDFRSKIIDKESIARLIYEIRNYPYKCRELFTVCVKKIFDNFFKNEEDIKYIDLYNMIQVGFNNFQDKPVLLNEIRSQLLSKYITTEGVISQFDEKPRVKILESAWTCSDCNRLYVNKGAKKPTKCIDAECSSRSFKPELNLNKTEDYLDIRLTQQFGGIQKNNTVDRYVRIAGTALVNHVLDNISPGQIAVVNAAVVLAEKLTIRMDDDNSSDIELDAFAIEQKNNINIFEYDERLLNIVKDYINANNIKQHVAKMKRSICAHIYKQDALKEAVLLLLVGTNPRIRPDGTRLKGDINVLAIGNSATGKSDFITFIQNVVPHSIKAGTKGSTSVAGLTTFVEKNQKTGKSMISLGVLALCDRKGVALVDEMNRRLKTDLYEFANAADDNQQIMVNKGGFHSIIYARCPIYATANSLQDNGVWNDSETVTKQTNLDAYILSRMDLVFVVRNERTKEHKEKMMDHIEKEYHKTILEKEYDMDVEGKNQLQRTEEILKGVEVSLRKNDFSGIYPIEYLRHELFYLKTIDCRLEENSEAYSLLKRFWTQYSNNMNMSSLGVGPGHNTDPMDVRKFASLQRMAEAYGRLHRCSKVTVEHAQMACDLMSISLASQIPQYENMEEQNEYARKMMEKNTIKKMAQSLSHEKQVLRNRNFIQFERELNRFNDVLWKQGYEICKKCHGTGETSELIDSETKRIEVHKCLDCEGKGGEFRGFSFLDFETNIIRNNIMSSKRCNSYFNMYKDKKFILYKSENDRNYLNINLKSPDVIDAIRGIAETLTDAVMEKMESDEQIKNMNRRI